jgi:DNA-binding CsgD family transcriptional regulator/tetratricopeptide (TPR) repeat protein
VRLFVERATQVQPGFTLTEATASAVARICTRLDGIPLAIELAAARVPLLTVEQIAARLDDAIRLLTGGSRTAAPRQQTLRATLEWSHDLLTEPERVLFRRLAVFAGGWTLEAAEAVCAGESLAPTSILDLLGRLVAKSLVQVEHGEETRYRLLETVRQYARERLEEADEGRAVGSRHARWYLALAEWAKPQTLTGQQQASWRRLEAEQENLRAALAWCLEHDPTTGLRLAACYWGMMIYRNQFTEGRYWLESFLARASEPSAERAAALGSLGRLAREHGELPLARARYEDALALRRELGDQRWLAWGLGELGGTLLLLGDLRQARVLLEEALPLIRPVGIPRDIGAIMGWLGWEAETAGDYDRAWSLLEESTAILRQVGDQVMICRNLWLLGRVALWRGDAARAQALLEEGLALVRAGGIPRWISLLTWQLGQVAHHQGDLAGAIDRYTASLNVARETGFRREIAWALAGLGLAAGHLDEVVEARGRLEESLTLFTTIGYTQGRAVALHGLGLAAWGQGEAVEAVARLQESLRLRQQMGERLGIAECLEGLAAVAVGQGHHGRAARLLGAAEAMREAIGAPLPPVERLDHVGAVRAAREALGERSFASAWAAGGALPLEQAVAEALGDEPASVAATGPTSITPLDPAGLTRREVEVLRLLAGGATDREIAGGLSISIKTVNKHVASILGKTGSANRTAAGAFAHQHGLG